MIKPLIPEEDVYSNKYALFKVDSIDTALNALKTVVNAKYDFNHEIKFVKNLTNNNRTLLVARDELSYKRGFDSNITMNSIEDENILRIKIQNFAKQPIDYTIEITKELYKQCTNTA
jgi:hypothetical protein